MSAREAFGAHLRVIEEAMELLSARTDEAARLVLDVLGRGGKILICGNGGSAADAQHFAAELVGRYRTNRRAQPCVALTTDTSTMTAIGNDLGFERIFARQVEALACAGDVLFTLSTGGNSPNIVAAALEGRKRGLTVVALTGRGGGALAHHADLLLPAPTDDTARAQEVHGLCLHALAEAVEAASGIST